MLPSRRKSAIALVTGGCGFIGSAFLRFLATQEEAPQKILILDKLTYAANPQAIASLPKEQFELIQGDICDRSLLDQLAASYQIDLVVHFAAQSHVDRSISHAQDFIETNIVGTYTLLEWLRAQKRPLHFHHISTDEVYGSLGLEEERHFDESSPYAPRSPYASSKAASDHLVRAWGHTYPEKLTYTISHCSNNYGPWQHQEKLIPCMLHRAFEGKPLTLYGSGENIRYWIHVDDHVEGIWRVITKAAPSTTYHFGGGPSSEMSNNDLLELLLEILHQDHGYDLEALRASILYIQDRPGHDLRYSIDASKAAKELLWQPRWSFKQGLQATVAWYLSRLSSR